MTEISLEKRKSDFARVQFRKSQKPIKFARIKFRESSLYRQMKHFANLPKICEITKFNFHKSLFPEGLLEIEPQKYSD